MKKFFTLVSVLALSAITFAATNVKMDFSDPTAYGYAAPAAGAYTQVNSGDTIAKDGVDLIVTFASGSGFRFYNSSGNINLRGYVNANLKIAAPEGKKLLRVVANGSNMSTTYMSGDMTSSSWEGEADALNINIIKSTVQINSLTIDFGNPGETPAAVVIDTIGVSEAVARIKAGNKDACYVKGVVAGDAFDLGANGPAFYMTDIDNPLDSLEGFKINKNAAGAAFADVADMDSIIGAGDTIMIYANGLALYNSATGPINETTSGYFVQTLGKSHAIILDWAYNQGSAYRDAGKWELEIHKAEGSTTDVMNLIFASDKENALAGFHTLEQGSTMSIDGSNQAITSGSVLLTFKEVSTNGYNVYAMNIVLVAGDQMYRLKQEIEFFATNDGEEVVLAGDRPFKPTVDGQEATCAEAREYALSLTGSDESEFSLTVTGYVTDLFTNGTAQFWMDDKSGNKTQTILVYMYKSLTPANVVLKNGAKVKVVGKVKNYNGKPEIVNAAVEVLEGGEEIPIIKVSVSEAVTAGMALDTSAVSTDLYEITGFITEVVDAYSETYKNITFWMNDDAADTAQVFQAFRIKADATIGDKLVKGAHVVVTAKIQNYYKAATDTTAEKHLIEAIEGTVVLYGTGVEEVFQIEKAVKFFHNGQIYIRRNDGVYNLQGIKVD